MDCFQKQQQLIELFAQYQNSDQKMHFLIDLGRKCSSLTLEERLEKHLVPGCQSRLYLKVTFQEGLLSIQTHSDALISAGLASLLVEVYNGQSPESVFKCPPLFIQEIGLLHALSPSRANGLKSLYQKLQKEASQWLHSTPS